MGVLFFVFVHSTIPKDTVMQATDNYGQAKFLFNLKNKYKSLIKARISVIKKYTGKTVDEDPAGC